MERQKKRALVAALQPLQTQTPTQQRAGGYYEPLRESAGPPRKHGARLQPLQPLAKPAARRAVSLTPSAERSPAEPEQQGGADAAAAQADKEAAAAAAWQAATAQAAAQAEAEIAELKLRVEHRDSTIAGLQEAAQGAEAKLAAQAEALALAEHRAQAAEARLSAQASQSAGELDTLRQQLQASSEGFDAQDNLIREQEKLIHSLQTKLHKHKLGPKPPPLPKPVVSAPKPSKGAREIAEAHAKSNLIWIDPWVNRGERSAGVRTMCTAGVREQLVEVSRQDRHALETGLVNLREQVGGMEDAKEAETLQFFLDFTAAALARLVPAQDGSG